MPCFLFFPLISESWECTYRDIDYSDTIYYIEILLAVHMGVAGTNDVSIVFLSKLKLQDSSKYCAVTDRYWDLVRLAIAGRN